MPTTHHADVMVVTVVTMNLSCLTFKLRAHARRFEHHRVVLNATRVVIGDVVAVYIVPSWACDSEKQFHWVACFGFH
jgi:hypothetical protein